MTDYIALLLDVQAEGERQEDRTWKPGDDQVVFPAETVDGSLFTAAGQRRGEEAAAGAGQSRAEEPAALGKIRNGTAEMDAAGREEEEKFTAAAGEAAGQIGLAEMGRAAAAAWTSLPHPLSRGMEQEYREAGSKRTAVEETLSERGFHQTWKEDEAQSAAETADWAYQALRVSLTELPAPKGETRVITLEKPGVRSDAGRLDPEGLDRLLRRDARRFDGGFQLL